MTSLVLLPLLLVLSLGTTAALLAVLFFVVRSAVEQGVRRALPDSALRPSVREQLGR